VRRRGVDDFKDAKVTVARRPNIVASRCQERTDVDRVVNVRALSLLMRLLYTIIMRSVSFEIVTSIP